jgi:hypothetical protein
MNRLKTSITGKFRCSIVTSDLTDLTGNQKIQWLRYDVSFHCQLDLPTKLPMAFLDWRDLAQQATAIVVQI